MAFGAPTVVEAPARQAVPYGLFSTFSFRDASDPHWANGVVWESLACGPASGIGDVDCEASNAAGETVAVGLPKGTAENSANGDASPFVVYAHEKCDPVGRASIAQDRVTAALIAKEQRRVEQAIWNGDLGNEPNLQEALVLGGGATSPHAVLALVTARMRQRYDTLGVLHVGGDTAGVLVAEDLIVFKGDRAFTVFGDAVSIGWGYDEHGGGPTLGPAAAGFGWVIMTPPIMGYRSEVFTSSNREGDLLDRGNNDFHALAERQYLLGWDDGCEAGAFAAQMSLVPAGADNGEVLAAITASQDAITANDDANLATLQGNITAASTAVQANDDANTATITGNDDTNTQTILDAIAAP